MRQFLTLLAVSGGVLTTLSCGTDRVATTPRSSSSGTTSHSTRTSIPSAHAQAGGYRHDDGDNDTDSEGHPRRGAVEDDRNFLDSHGREAPPDARRAVARVVRRYYAAAADGNGAEACALLNGKFATALSEGEPRSGNGDGCATSLSHIFMQARQELLADDVATMTIVGVHTQGSQGLAILGFRTMPKSEILVQREHGIWGIAALLAGELP